MKSFDIPEFYRSSLITSLKRARNAIDRRKLDLNPTVLDFGPVQFIIARHFGFCYGVENAIEISYRALEENPGKRIFLLSQMIHNPVVNEDLQERGIKFIMDTEGNRFVEWDELKSDDIVIVPAFGTTLEIEQELSSRGIEIQKYNTTCPFVEKVWNRSSKLGKEGNTIIIHGKHNHEETRATFSHAKSDAPAVVIRDMKDAEFLGDVILGKLSSDDFYNHFKNRYSNGFSVEHDLDRVGVVNQTTMLATETQAIADYFKSIMISKYGEEKIKEHFADTRDTLCYATNDNQQATYAVLETEADLAIVVGGYNSSNTSHIVELCEEILPTYFINSHSEILSKEKIRHFIYDSKSFETAEDFLKFDSPVRIILTSGASCPDAQVELVLNKLLSFFPKSSPPEEVFEKAMMQYNTSGE